MDTKKLEAELKQLFEIRKLYDCQFKCVLAISYLLENNLFSSENVKNIFDPNKKCHLGSVREFFQKELPEIGSCCLCSDCGEKIRAMNVVYTVTKVDMQK
ncbi:MAG: hypothetical protein WC511_02775 [Candidatus Pacearchaeota archaeon]